MVGTDFVALQSQSRRPSELATTTSSLPPAAKMDSMLSSITMVVSRAHDAELSQVIRHLGAAQRLEETSAKLVTNRVQTASKQRVKSLVYDLSCHLQVLHKDAAMPDRDSG